MQKAQQQAHSVDPNDDPSALSGGIFGDLLGAGQTGKDQTGTGLIADIGKMFVCDLDGTLIRSDMLDESFWSAVAADWRTPFAAFMAMLQGRAALKADLAGRAHIDAAQLPYRTSVLDGLRRWRAQGGRIALVTATDQRLADQIAGHLGLFDEVHGSTADRNLKAATKAAFLTEHYASTGFVYIGDSAADLPVWEAAQGAITIGLNATLRRKVRSQGRIVHIDDTPPRTQDNGITPAQASPADTGPSSAETAHSALSPFDATIRAMRPHQWMKNILIFLPLLAAHQWDAISLMRAALAFVAFGLVASSVYVINDLLDLPSDRAHPRKRFRPFASGALSLRIGLWLAPGLILTGVALGAFAGWGFLAVLAGYFVTTTAYSLWLKRIAILDICTLAALYAVRIVAGGVATQVPLSVWLLAFSIFFFFSLAAVKRQAELVDNLASGRGTNARRGYRTDDLPLVTMMALASGYVSVLVMALYVNSPTVMSLYSTPEVLWGISAVLLFWISRMVLITHRGDMHDDPVVFAVRDRVSLGAFAVVLVFVVIGGQF